MILWAYRKRELVRSRSRSSGNRAALQKLLELEN